MAAQHKDLAITILTIKAVNVSRHARMARQFNIEITQFCLREGRLMGAGLSQGGPSTHLSGFHSVNWDGHRGPV